MLHYTLLFRSYLPLCISIQLIIIIIIIILIIIIIIIIIIIKTFINESAY